jgi:hypothetical protein
MRADLYDPTRVIQNLDLQDATLAETPFTDAEGVELISMMEKCQFIDQEAREMGGTSILDILVNLNQLQQCCTTFRTKGQRLGHTNGKIKIGDHVVLFDGAKAPYIIRKSTERKGAYEIIGDVYLHGVMNGEVDILNLKSEGITLI